MPQPDVSSLDSAAPGATTADHATDEEALDVTARAAAADDKSDE